MMQFQESVDFLHKIFGSHAAVAEYLGIAWGHYSRIRNGKVKIPKRTADYIILKAKEAESAARDRADA